MLLAQFNDGLCCEHIHAQSTAGDKMTIAHVIERLDRSPNAFFEINAARICFVKAERHFLRTIARESAAAGVGWACPSYYIFHRIAISLFIAHITADNTFNAPLHSLGVQYPVESQFDGRCSGLSQIAVHVDFSAVRQCQTNALVYSFEGSAGILRG